MSVMLRSLTGGNLERYRGLDIRVVGFWVERITEGDMVI